MDDVDSSFQKISQATNYELSTKEQELIRRAIKTAQTAHAEQKRHSGEPYFTHVLGTAVILAELGMDSLTITAGLLHDVLEDTETTPEELTVEFGPEIVRLVEGVTKLGKVKYHGRDRHVESLRKFFMAMADDVRVLIIKLADRVHNLRTLEHLRPEKQARIALESIEIHAALANRLGMGKLKGDIEDLAFPYAYPKEYEKVVSLVKEKHAVDQKYLTEIHEVLLETLKENGFKDAQIDYRIKHFYSLWRKLRKYDMDIEKIYDIIALRVIVPTVSDCYQVLGLVHSIWNPLPGRIKDYIALPKPNGYQSLHTTIFTGSGGICEIQIRTPEMHEEAEYGVASHFMYKSNGQNEHSDSFRLGTEKFAWMSELTDLQKVVAEPLKFLEHLKMDFFKDRIFIFTPSGDVVDLPEDSTPIDFAYAIHSKIGDHAAGARVNGKYVALKTKLQSGDIVRIDTKEASHPNSSWLEFTKTTAAKKKIRTYLQEHGGLLTNIWRKFKN